MGSICVPLLCDPFPGAENSVEFSCDNQDLRDQTETCQTACGSAPSEGDSENLKCKYYQCQAACVPCFCTDDDQYKTWLQEYDRPGCPLLCGGVNTREEYGTEVTVTCRTDYFLEGGTCSANSPQSGNATCDLQGKWASVPKCKKIPVAGQKKLSVPGPERQDACRFEHRQ
jgi:hypothetical protein